MAMTQYKAVRFDLIDHDKEAHRRSNFMDLTDPSGFALATLAVLRGKLDDFGVHFGLKCASFSKMNTGTSARSACTAIGVEEYQSVNTGNMLMERSCLLILLCTCLGAAWSLEQPSGSLAEYYPAFRETIRSIFDSGGPDAVQNVRWWMHHFKSLTPKRHYAYSNSKPIHRLDKGVLQGWKAKKKEENGVVTATRYIDANGKKRYKGTTSLKSTEIYPVPFARAFCDMLEDLKAACKGKPELPDPVPEALTSFQQMEYADPEIWRTTCFTEVYDYLRRNKKLRIPAEWQALLPARLYEVS
ncbi:unnamed protein product [Cladocopium goreaui]|uniref:Uncharacterized protein n=1 Tax=Cladocopium goreaui TaxID=2562237 RepID=A0A9P1M1I4_9DINO|nr:unnamed protein product [Cladocopium goreaui]